MPEEALKINTPHFAKKVININEKEQPSRSIDEKLRSRRDQEKDAASANGAAPSNKSQNE